MIDNIDRLKQRHGLDLQIISHRINRIANACTAKKYPNIFKVNKSPLYSM